MGSVWQARRRKIQTDHDRDDLTIVPELLSVDDGKSFVESKITSEFDRTSEEEIVVIDPYIDAKSVQKVVKLFVTQNNRSLKYLTKYDSPGDMNKTQMQSSLERMKKDINDKHLFSDFDILKMDFPFHDRYLMSIRDGKVNICFMVGASFNQLFESYSAIVRINNSYFKRQLLKVVHKCI